MARDLSTRSQYHHMPSQRKVVLTKPSVPKTSHEILPAARILLGSIQPKYIGVKPINPMEQTKKNFAARLVINQSSLNIFSSPSRPSFVGLQKIHAS
jgi:hypothetical protein